MNTKKKQFAIVCYVKFPIVIRGFPVYFGVIIFEPDSSMGSCMSGLRTSASSPWAAAPIPLLAIHIFDPSATGLRPTDVSGN